MTDKRTPHHTILRSYTTTDGKVHEHLPPAKRHESKLAAIEKLCWLINCELGISEDVETVLKFLLENTNIIKVKTLIAEFSPPLDEIKTRVKTTSTKVGR